jgi:hypothetical protein
MMTPSRMGVDTMVIRILPQRENKVVAPPNSMHQNPCSSCKNKTPPNNTKRIYTTNIVKPESCIYLCFLASLISKYLLSKPNFSYRNLAGLSGSTCRAISPLANFMAFSMIFLPMPKPL